MVAKPHQRLNAIWQFVRCTDATHIGKVESIGARSLSISDQIRIRRVVKRRLWVRHGMFSFVPGQFASRAPR